MRTAREKVCRARCEKRAMADIFASMSTPASRYDTAREGIFREAISLRLAVRGMGAFQVGRRVAVPSAESANYGTRLSGLSKLSDCREKGWRDAWGLAGPRGICAWIPLQLEKRPRFWPLCRCQIIYFDVFGGCPVRSRRTGWNRQVGMALERARELMHHRRSSHYPRFKPLAPFAIFLWSVLLLPSVPASHEEEQASSASPGAHLPRHRLGPGFRRAGAGHHLFKSPWAGIQFSLPTQGGNRRGFRRKSCEVSRTATSPSAGAIRSCPRLPATSMPRLWRSCLPFPRCCASTLMPRRELTWRNHSRS